MELHLTARQRPEQQCPSYGNLDSAIVRASQVAASLEEACRTIALDIPPALERSFERLGTHDKWVANTAVLVAVDNVAQDASGVVVTITELVHPMGLAPSFQP